MDKPLSGARWMKKKGYTATTLWISPKEREILAAMAEEFSLPLATYCRLRILASSAAPADRPAVYAQLSERDRSIFVAMCNQLFSTETNPT